MLERIYKNSNIFVLVAYIAVTFLFTCPLVFHFNTHVPGYGGDEHLFLWNFWWMKKALFELCENPLYTSYLLYPYGTSIAVHSHALFNFAVTIPLHFILKAITVYNVMVIFSFALSGYGMYLLTLRFVKNKAASFVSGFIFAFFPYKFAHLIGGHMGLVGTEWIPFYVLYLIRMTEDGYRLKNALLAGLFIYMSTMCSYYYLVFLILFTAIYWIYTLVTRSELILNTRFVKKFLFFLIIPTLGMIPIIMMTFREFTYGSYNFGDTRNYSQFVSDLVAFFTPSVFHPLFRKSLRDFYILDLTGGIPENNIFLGYTVMFLSVYGLVKFKPDWKKYRFWLISAVVFVVLSIGPNIHIYGKEYPIPMPSWILMYLPLFSGIRCYSRFIILAMLSLSILSAFALSEFVARSKNKTLPVMVVGLFLVFEYLPVPIPLYKPDVPVIYEKIAEDKNDVSVLSVPFGWDITNVLIGDPNLMHQYYQTVHNKRLISAVVSRGSVTQGDHILEMPVFNELYTLQNKMPYKIKSDFTESEISVEDVMNYFKIGYIIIHKPYLGSDVQDYMENKSGINMREIYSDDKLIAYKVLEIHRDVKGIISPQFKYGWNPLEFWDKGDTMRWSSGRKSLVFLSLEQKDDYKMRIKMIPFPIDSDNQSVKIYSNGKYITEKKLDSGWKEYSVDIPAKYLKKGSNYIGFKYKYTGVPGRLYPDSQDRRQLAVGVDYIKMRKTN